MKKHKANTPKVKHIKHRDIQNYAINSNINLWFHKHLVLNDGWKFYKEGSTGKGIRVAVLDSGCSYHQRFDMSKIQRKSYIPDESPDDIRNHGTHVISRIIGKSIYQGEIITGLAPDIDQLYSYKVIDKNDHISFDAMFNALDDIRKMDSSTRPHFINMSLGADISPPWTDDVQRVVNILEDLSKIIYIGAAAGNSRQWWNPNSGNPLFPAKLPYIVSTSSVDNLKQPSTFAARGKVEDTQFGEDSLGFSNDGKSFTRGRGTSFSHPMNTGFKVAFASKLLVGGMKIEDVIKNIDSLLLANNMFENLGTSSDFGKGLLRRV
jgi:major intracellular serine protease